MDKMGVSYIAVLFLLITTSLCDDWTASCPSNCTCKWSNGKKSAICNSLELTTIPTNLSTELQVLVLNENHISYLNREEFTSLGLINLQRIYLKKSKVKYIHKEAFKNLKILIEIDLSENEIESLDKGTFYGNDRLRILYLFGNPIKQLIADQFPALNHLRSLDLHDCQINYIDTDAFLNLQQLELLNLKNNSLENLGENVFYHMKNLKTLLLEDNPWNCDCKLRNFRSWYLKSNLNSVSLQCRNPVHFKEEVWEGVDEEKFGCPPIVELLTGGVYGDVLGNNITFSCFVKGDPRPDISWDLNGKIFDNDNIIIEAEQINEELAWSNLTVFNVTSLDGGLYTCGARNSIGFSSKNFSLNLPEIVDTVTVKTPETFWYFGLILGTFGTVFGLILISVLICVCKKASRRHSKRHLKTSVSFNDQEKKLLDLSITTNERQDSCDTPSANKVDPVIPLEPVQITIENISRNEEFPLNVGVFPPPPEFCSSVLPNPAYGNIFISVSVTQDALDNPDLNMYPDLLNIPNRVKGKLVPINVASYATLPRKSKMGGSMASTSGCKHDTTTISENLVNYHNLETTNFMNDTRKMAPGMCIGCIKNQQSHCQFLPPPPGVPSTSVAGQTDTFGTCEGKFFCPKYDNMGRRVTASGNSTLSLPDEEQMEHDMLYNNTTNLHCIEKDIQEIPTPPLPPTVTAIAAATAASNAATTSTSTGSDFVSL